jgi:hypothetical protein
MYITSQNTSTLSTILVLLVGRSPMTYPPAIAKGGRLGVVFCFSPPTAHLWHSQPFCWYQEDDLEEEVAMMTGMSLSKEMCKIVLPYPVVAYIDPDLFKYVRIDVWLLSGTTMNGIIYGVDKSGCSSTCLGTGGAAISTQ